MSQRAGLARVLALALALVLSLAMDLRQAAAINSSVALNGTVGTAFSQIPAYSSNAPFTGAVLASGALPPGITLAGSGLLSGTPTTAGTYNFNVNATDSSSIEFVRSVSFVVADVPAPTVAAASATVPFNSSGATIGLSGSVTGSATSITVGAAPAHGAAVVSGFNVIYTPTTGFSGSDSFTYTATGPGGTSSPATVTVTVASPVSAPTAAATTATVPFNSPGYLIDLSKSITGTAASVTVGTAPAHGKVVVSALGATYTPTTGYAGSDSFTYTATGPGGTSAAATVTITVQGLPDPTTDPDVTAIIGAEGDEVGHFADLQVADVNSHLEGLHDGSSGGGGGVNLTLAALGGGAPVPGSTSQGAFTPTSVTLGNILRAADGAAAKPVAGWITGGVQFGRLSGTAKRSATQSTTIGLTSGVDFRIDRTLTLGGGVGYNQDDAKIGSNSSQVTSHGYFGIAYGSYHPQVAGLYLDGQVGYGGMHFDSRRFVTFTGSTATGSRNGGAWFGSATFGSEQQTGDVRWAPYARLVAMAGTLNAFTETGGGSYNLAYSSQKVSSTSIALGVRASEQVALGEGVLTPRARLEYIGSVSSADTVSMTYPALISSPIYALSENLLDSAQTVLGIGAGYRWKNGMSVSADYTGTVSYVSRSAQRVIFGFKAPF